MEQHFITFKPLFYLRNPKAKKPTNIYLMLRINGKQIRLATSVKVIPDQWNHDEQVAYISHRLNELDNVNNEIVNEKLNAIKLRYNEFIDYICVNPEKIVNCHQLLKEYIYNMTKNDKKMTENDIILFLNKNILSDLEIREDTKKNYIKSLRALKAFFQYRKEKGEKEITEFKEFTSEFFYAMGDFLPQSFKQPNGKPYSMTTINDFLKLTYIVITKYAVTGGFITIAESQSIKYKQLKNKTSKDNEIFLRNDEIIKLYNYQPTNILDEIVRDVFLLECLSGQRISDTLRLDDNIQEIMGVQQITLIPNKVQEKKITVNLIFDIAKKILVDKYNYKMPKCTKDQINHRIKKIAKEAGIQGVETISKHYAGNSTVTTVKKERWQCISTHTGRRTFVSLLTLRGWNYEQIGKYTAQSLKIVELYDKTSPSDFEIYKKTHSDNIVKFIDEVKTVNKEDIHIEITHSKGILTNIVNSIDEAKAVLNYLGAEVDEYIEEKNIDELIKMIGYYEKTITKEFNANVADIKYIFNNYGTAKQKKEHLHNLLEIINPRK